MATQSIKLKKNVGDHKKDAIINATADELHKLDLKPGVDYEPLGTHPRPVKSDLAKEQDNREGAKTSGNTPK